MQSIQIVLAFFCVVSSLATPTKDDCQVWTSVDRTTFNKTFVALNDPLANVIRPYGYKALIYKKYHGDFCVVVPLKSGKNREIELKLDIKNNDPFYVKTAENEYQNTLDDKETHCIKVKDGEKSKQFIFHCNNEDCNAKEVELWYRFQAIYEDSGPKCNDNFDEFPLDHMETPTKPTTTSKSTTKSTTTTKSGSESILFNQLLLALTLGAYFLSF